MVWRLVIELFASCLASLEDVQASLSLPKVPTKTWIGLEQRPWKELIPSRHK